jgi:hypothetical protein
VTAADLRDVDDLCRLAVVARRLGCHIHVPEIDRGLWELIELAGVVDVVRACPATASGRDRRAVPETYDA